MASSSQFFGLNIASSALSAFQASINTAANNVSNVQTKGYSKQVTNLEASGALRVNAKYGTTGTGVTAKSIERLRDAYYDTKYRDNQSDFGRYEKKLYYMQEIEMYYEDDHKEIGFSTLLKKMFNNWIRFRRIPATRTSENSLSAAHRALQHISTAWRLI